MPGVRTRGVRTLLARSDMRVGGCGKTVEEAFEQVRHIVQQSYANSRSNADVSAITDAGLRLWQCFVCSTNLEFFVHTDDLPPVGADIT